MRITLLGLMALAALAACSKPATDTVANTGANAAANTAAAAPAGVNPGAASATPASTAVSGTFTMNGKPAALTEASAHKGDAFFDKPIIDLVLTEKSQMGSDKPAEDAIFSNFGDALVAHIEEDGTLTGVELVHAGRKDAQGSISVAGPIKMADFKSEGGQISGRLTTDGPIDLFDNKVDINVTFRAKWP
jgi:hypothetical protein